MILIPTNFAKYISARNTHYWVLLLHHYPYKFRSTIYYTMRIERISEIPTELYGLSKEQLNTLKRKFHLTASEIKILIHLNKKYRNNSKAFLNFQIT